MWQQRHLGDRVPLGSVCPVARWSVPGQGGHTTQVLGWGWTGDSLHSLGRHTLGQVTPIHNYKGTGQQNRITRSQEAGQTGTCGCLPSRVPGVQGHPRKHEALSQKHNTEKQVVEE